LERRDCLDGLAISSEEDSDEDSDENYGYSDGSSLRKIFFTFSHWSKGRAGFTRSWQFVIIIIAMPTKKITIGESSAIDNKSSASTKLIFGIIVAILVLFAGNVLY
jgi:hypothetical protein